jgi:hypothetical protein
VTHPSIGTEFPPVLLISRLLLGLACGLGFASAAAGQDLTAAPKVACTPESVTRCEAADKCTTRPASARDRGEVLVIDFGAKAASINRNGATKKFADVIDEGVSDGARKFSLAEGGRGDGLKLAGTLDKSGKLTLTIDRNGSKAQAICVRS